MIMRMHMMAFWVYVCVYGQCEFYVCVVTAHTHNTMLRLCNVRSMITCGRLCSFLYMCVSVCMYVCMYYYYYYYYCLGLLTLSRSLFCLELGEWGLVVVILRFLCGVGWLVESESVLRVCSVGLRKSCLVY